MCFQVRVMVWSEKSSGDILGDEGTIHQLSRNSSWFPGTLTILDRKVRNGRALNIVPTNILFSQDSCKTFEKDLSHPLMQLGEFAYKVWKYKNSPLCEENYYHALIVLYTFAVTSFLINCSLASHSLSFMQNGTKLEVPNILDYITCTLTDKPGRPFYAATVSFVWMLLSFQCN